MEFLGDHVWTELELPIARSARRRAAIAFAGRTAAQILPLRRDDIIVVDGSDEALAAGGTHPDAVQAWLAAGAIVQSLPGLHAKVILLENANGTRTAIVGSANASENSRDRLIEAAVMTDDEALCEAVSDQLDIWTASADPLNDDWLPHARRVYRESRHPRSVRRPQRLRPDRSKPLWIGISAPTTEKLTPAAEVAHQQVASRYGRGAEIRWWLLNPGDESKVLPGHNVVLINHASDRDEPHGNSTAWAPAIVARVEPGAKRHRPIAFLVTEPDLDQRRFTDVKAAIHHAGGVIDWNLPLGPGPISDAVYALWPPR